jgi:hypothetical protein
MGKISATILILVMIVMLTIVGFACITIANWGIIGYSVISFASLVLLIYGLIIIWIYKDKRNVITKGKTDWKP